MNIRIFFNLNYLEISEGETHAPLNQAVNTYVVDKANRGELKNIISKFLEAGQSVPFKILTNDSEAIYNDLKKQFVYIEAAGGFIEKQGEYLFIHRHGLWDLPKGKREKNESIEDCAIRECEEECGVKNLKIQKALNPSYHVYDYKGAFALKKSYWFYMTTNFDKALTPQLEEDIQQVKWFKKADALNVVMPDTYLTIKEVIKDALKL